MAATKEFICKINGGAVTEVKSIVIELENGNLPQSFLDDGWLLGIINNPGTIEPYEILGNLQWSVNNGDPVADYQISQKPLDDYKDERNREINNKTEELIKNGFTFDSNTFGLSLDKRIDWLGIKTLTDAGILDETGSFPYEISTIEGSAYNLTYADVDSFITAALGAYKGHKDSGRTLKDQINSANTHADVKAVVDNR